MTPRRAADPTVRVGERSRATGVVALAVALVLVGARSELGCARRRPLRRRGDRRDHRRRAERPRPARAAGLRAVDRQFVPRHLERRCSRGWAHGRGDDRAGRVARAPPWSAASVALRPLVALVSHHSCSEGPTTPSGSIATAGGSRGRPIRTLAALGVLAACGAVVEDAGASWGAIYLKDDLGTAAAVAGLAFVALQTAMTIGTAHRRPRRRSLRPAHGRAHRRRRDRRRHGLRVGGARARRRH